MNLRIRYQPQKGKENTLISINEYVSQRTGARYKVVLDLNVMVFKIRNERNKEFSFKSKAYGNINVLKRNARARLGELGVPLTREVRDRTFGVCKKGYSQKKHETEEDIKKDK